MVDFEDVGLNIHFILNLPCRSPQAQIEYVGNFITPDSAKVVHRLSPAPRIDIGSQCFNLLCLRNVSVSVSVSQSSNVEFFSALPSLGGGSGRGGYQMKRAFKDHDSRM